MGNPHGPCPGRWGEDDLDEEMGLPHDWLLGTAFDICHYCEGRKP